MKPSLSGVLAFAIGIGLFVALGLAPSREPLPQESAAPAPTKAPAPDQPPAQSAQPVRQAGARSEPRAPITFATLDGDQQIVVRYYTSGCFHHARYRMTFRHDEGLAVEVARVDAKGAETVLGTTRLGAEQAAKLDNLIAFYRGLKGDGGCTTQEEIEIETREGGRPAASEKFVDGTCSTYDRADLQTLLPIARDVEDANRAKEEAARPKK